MNLSLLSLVGDPLAALFFYMSASWLAASLACVSLADPSGQHLAVVSKVIVDTISGVQRAGGGGVQAAVGAKVGALLASSASGIEDVSLHAPVGRDFDRSLLARFDDYGIKYESSVLQVDSVGTTPGEIISYDDNVDDGRMQFTPVGWDGWEELCEWEPPTILAAAAAAGRATEGALDAFHVLVEGAGAGEVRSVLEAAAASRKAGVGLPTIGVEPIMHEVTAQSVAGLRRLTMFATLCSPDLPTAVCMRDVAVATPSNGEGVEVGSRPAALGRDALAEMRADDDALLELGCAVFDELAMQPGAILAIRDGAHGSYLYSRPTPDAPPHQWLASVASRDSEWLVRVPAVALDEVADPTGAGNAYAGAFSAQLAAGVHPINAAATATAVGAAFCQTAEWAPPCPDAMRAWVERERVPVEDRSQVVVPGATTPSGV